MSDPMEQLIADALDYHGIEYVREQDPRAYKLDFYLPLQDVHIEVKRFHADRIAEQMSRVPNVIVAQGIEAVTVLANLIRYSKN